MAYSIKNDVLNSISAVYNLSKNCKLEPEFFKEPSTELNFLSEYLHISHLQTILFSFIFTNNYSGHNASMVDLYWHLDNDKLAFFQLSDDIRALLDKQLIRKINKKNRNEFFKLSGSNNEFYVNELIPKIIFNKEAFPKRFAINEKFDDIFSFLEKLSKFIKQREDEEISTKELFESTQSIIEQNTHLQLVERINDFHAPMDEKYLLFHLIWYYIERKKHQNVEHTFGNIYDNTKERYTQLQSFLSKENVLISENWVEIEGGEFLDEYKMKLTDKAMELLSQCGIELYNKIPAIKKKQILIQPSEVLFRNLIFSGPEEKQLELLRSLLSEDNFNMAKERLVQKSLPKGVTALLHGLPGTGKTESVLQIAKATNREIMKVDISSTRSMWFGESEKLLKKVFVDYKDQIKNNTPTPILFFNEADAFFSNRKEIPNSNLSDTINRIQNILLEELENFEGILLATTNLAKNFDTAFERRFLFKIEIKKPGTLAKSQIWRSKLPHLSIEDCELLAEKFDFSGGQIDNIVRKSEINEIIYGTKGALNQLIDFCEEETLSNRSKRKSMGFITK